MNRTHRFLPLALLATALVLLPSALVNSQGSLTPPGAPAPTMKTLDQVEPRTPVNATTTPGDATNQFIISAAGSYYLTGNITGVSGKNGITISASNVSLDLNGFTLQGVAGSSHGVNATAAGTSNLSVQNGTVTGWGGRGLSLTASLLQVAHILASDNVGGGIMGFSQGTITNCVARANGSTGIALYGSGVISNSLALLNTGTGILINSGGVIIASSSVSNTGEGIELFNGRSLVTGCQVNNNGGNGIEAQSDSFVSKCSISFNTGNGVTASFSNRIVDNVICRNTASGIETALTGGGGKTDIENNTITENGTGLKLRASGNNIANNIVRANILNYDIAANNQLSLVLSELPQSIDWPAQVTLAGTLTGTSGQNGITVASDDVTVDLGGHALVGVAGSLKGVLISGARSNLVVRNGTVRSWGGDGIDAATSVNGQFDRLQLSNNGGRGMNIGDRALVTDCAAKQNGSHGFFGGIIDTISRCEAAVNGGIGISVSETAQIEKCNLNNNTGGGISVSNWSVIRDNNCDFHTTAAGISVRGSRNRIEGNHLTRNQNGITLTVSSSSNTVIRNSASGSTGGGAPPAPNYNINGASNDVGPVGTAAASTSPWANLSN